MFSQMLKTQHFQTPFTTVSDSVQYAHNKRKADVLAKLF